MSGENIEKLKNELSTIKEELDKLKTDASKSEEDKEKEANKLLEQAKEAEKKLREEIDNVNQALKIDEKSVDDKIKRAKEEAESFLNENIMKEIQNLHDSIKPTTIPAITVPSPKVSPENQNIFSKTGNWIKEQRDKTTLENLEKNPWDTLLRRVGFALTWVWGLALAVKWIRKLWKWALKDDNEDNENTDQETETKKKPFWDRRYWKVIKYSWIWTAAYYVIHWITTGRRNPSEIFKRGDQKPDTISSAENQVEWAEDLREDDPEKFEKYKWLWEKIDNQYNDLMWKEMKLWWWWTSIKDWYDKYVDKSKLTQDEFQAVVPMCVDNQFSSVSDMLSETGYFRYILLKDFSELKNLIQDILDGTTKLWVNAIAPFVKCLNSFKNVKWSDITEKIKNWINNGNEDERAAELNLFFRNYVKVLSYMQDKRNALVEIIAKEKLKRNNELNPGEMDFTDVEDAIHNKKRFEENIESDPRYINFMNWKISTAIDIMKDPNIKIFDNKLSETFESVKKAVDGNRSKILNEKDWKDALSRLDESKSTMKKENYDEWVEVTENLEEHINEYFEENRTWWLSFIDTAWNLSEESKQEFIKESWIWAMKRIILDKLKNYKLKFKNKSITSDEIDEYNNLVNSYFAMEKEVEVAMKTIHDVKEDNSDYKVRLLSTIGAIWYDFFRHTKKCREDLRDWKPIDARIQATFPLCWLAAASSIFGTKGRTLARWVFLVSIPWVAKEATILWLRNTSYISRMPIWMLKIRYNIEDGDKLLLQDILEWKISWTKAENIIKSWNRKRIYWDKLRSLEDFIEKMIWDPTWEMLTKTQIRDLFKTELNIWWKKVKIEFMSNESIRKQILGKVTWTEKHIKSWCYIRNYDYSKISDNLKEHGFAELFWWEWWVWKINSLSEFQLKLLKDIVEGCEFSNPEKQLKSLLNNIDKINLEGVSEEDLVKIIKELWENPPELEDLTKIQERINLYKTKIIPAERINQPIFWKINTAEDELKAQLWKVTDEAKIRQIEDEIKALEDFKNDISGMPDADFKRINSLVECFQGSWSKKSFREVIRDVERLKRIMEINWWEIKIEWKSLKIDDIIKNIDTCPDVLRKAWKLYPEFKSDFETIAKVFDEIKLKNVKNLLWSADEILKSIKTLLKLARIAK